MRDGALFTDNGGPSLPTAGTGGPAQAMRSSPMILTSLCIAVVLILPVPLSVVGGAAVAKLAFPALASVLALYLASSAPSRYVTFVVLVFMVAPGMRHFVDWYAGYSRVNPILLAPYFVILVGSPQAVLYLLNRGPYTVAFTALLLVIAGGLAVPILHGNIQSALLASMRWICPVIFGLHIIACKEPHAVVRAAIRRTFVIALPMMAIYGVWQFVSIPPWDAFFMTESSSEGGFSSIGYPLPFQVRVFGFMNSPGSLAALLGTGMLLTIPAIRGLGWVTFIVTFGTLLITSQRASMGGLFVAILVLAVSGRDHIMRAALGRFAAVLALTLLIAVSVPGVSKRLEKTLNSVAHLNDDLSAQERLLQYHNFPLWLDADPLGRGLGWDRDPVYVRVGDRVVTDSGIIDGFVTLGVPGGLLFFTALGMLMLSGAAVALKSPDPEAQAEFAAVVFGLAQLPMGPQETSEHGVFLYLAIGLLLARGAGLYIRPPAPAVARTARTAA